MVCGVLFNVFIHWSSEIKFTRLRCCGLYVQCLDVNNMLIGAVSQDIVIKSN